MSNSKVLVPVDETSILKRAGSAWNIIKGDKTANPLYPQLLSLQHELATVNTIAKTVVSSDGKSTIDLIKDLVTQYQNLSASYTDSQKELSELLATHTLQSRNLDTANAEIANLTELNRKQNEINRIQNEINQKQTDQLVSLERTLARIKAIVNDQEISSITNEKLPDILPETSYESEI